MRTINRATLLGFIFLPSVLASVSWDDWWTYDGISGPQFWGLINPDWSLCNTGRRQSPVNLEPDKLLYDPNLRSIHVDSSRINGEIINTGHSVQFIPESQSRSSINVTGGPLSYRYQFHELQLHFGMQDKFGSEHTINGYAFPAELQIYGFNSQLYRNFSEASMRSQGLVAISLLVQLGDLSNPELRILTDQLEKLKHRGNTLQVRQLSIAKLLPDTESYITYDGSTSMPACHETVTWLILNKPIYITRQQLHVLRQLLQNDTKNPRAPLGDNYRPPQPLHNRLLRTNIDFNTDKESEYQCPTMKKEVHYKGSVDDDSCYFLEVYVGKPLNVWPWRCLAKTHPNLFGDVSRQQGLLRVLALYGEFWILRHVIEVLNVTVETDDQKLLLAAASSGNLELIKYLVLEKNLTKEAAETTFPGDSALHKAAQRGKIDVVRFFIEKLHYKVDSMNWNSDTAAKYAIMMPSYAVFRYLVEEAGADYNNSPPSGENLIFHAAACGNLFIMQYLVDMLGVDPALKSVEKGSPLNEACRSGYLDVIKYLVEEKHVSLYGRDNMQRTLLHSAVEGRDRISDDSVRLGLAVLKYLIENSTLLSQIDEANYDNRTVAMEAAFLGYLPIVRYLVDEKNASTNMVTLAKYNMLHLAILGHSLPMVKYLVEEKGFNLNARNADGRNAVELAEYLMSSNKASSINIIKPVKEVLEYLRKAATELELSLRKCGKV